MNTNFEGERCKSDIETLRRLAEHLSKSAPMGTAAMLLALLAGLLRVLHNLNDRVVSLETGGNEDDRR